MRGHRSIVLAVIVGVSGVVDGYAADIEELAVQVRLRAEDGRRNIVTVRDGDRLHGIEGVRLRMGPEFEGAVAAFVIGESGTVQALYPASGQGQAPTVTRGRAAYLPVNGEFVATSLAPGRLRMVVMHGKSMSRDILTLARYLQARSASDADLDGDLGNGIRAWHVRLVHSIVHAAVPVPSEASRVGGSKPRVVMVPPLAMESAMRVAPAAVARELPGSAKALAPRPEGAVANTLTQVFGTSEDVPEASVPVPESAPPGGDVPRPLTALGSFVTGLIGLTDREPATVQGDREPGAVPETTEARPLPAPETVKAISPAASEPGQASTTVPSPRPRSLRGSDLPVREPSLPVAVDGREVPVAGETALSATPVGSTEAPIPSASSERLAAAAPATTRLRPSAPGQRQQPVTASSTEPVAPVRSTATLVETPLEGAAAGRLAPVQEPSTQPAPSTAASLSRARPAPAEPAAAVAPMREQSATPPTELAAPAIASAPRPAAAVPGPGAASTTVVLPVAPSASDTGSEAVAAPARSPRTVPKREVDEGNPEGVLAGVGARISRFVTRQPAPAPAGAGAAGAPSGVVRVRSAAGTVTGVLVAKDRVVTAWRSLSAGGPVEVELAGPPILRRPARVLRRDLAMGLALLEVTGLPAPIKPVALAGGRVTRSGARLVTVYPQDDGVARGMVTVEQAPREATWQSHTGITHRAEVIRARADGTGSMAAPGASLLNERMELVGLVAASPGDGGALIAISARSIQHFLAADGG